MGIRSRFSSLWAHGFCLILATQIKFMKKFLILIPAFSLLFSLIRAQAPGSIMIVEIMKDPSLAGSLDSLGEWFEVHNTTASPININGWIIYDNDFDRDTIINGVPLMVPANGFLVLGSNGNSAQNGGYVCDFVYTYSQFKLGNGDDEIILKTPGGVVVDSVRYLDGPQWPDPTGASLVFTGCDWDNNQDSTLWLVSTVREMDYQFAGADFGSPGTSGVLQTGGVTALSFVVSQITCNGANNGAINMTIIGCTGPYSSLWLTTGSPTEDVSGLSPGWHHVQVTDGLGGNTFDSILIVQPAVLNSSLTSINPSCPTYLNGSVDLTVTGGRTPYTYVWNTGPTTQDLNGVPANNYSVTITDSSGCTTTNQVNLVNLPNTLSSSLTTTPAGCPNYTNGAVNLSPSGGQGPLTYLWSNNATSQDLNGLSSGTFTVIITDSIGCTRIDTAIVAVVPGSITSSSLSTAARCPSFSNGSINLTASGGTGTLNYSWLHGFSGQDPVGLSRGWYYVTISDQGGCTRTDSAFVDSIPQTLTFTGVVNPQSCTAIVNGAINVSPSGGNGPMTYSWSNSASSQDLSGLSAGTYILILTDSAGCSKTDSFVVNVGTGPLLTLTPTHVSCNGGSNGRINASVSGGTAPFQYLWSNSFTGQNPTGLVPGMYSVTVTDTNACTDTDSVQITAPSILVVNASSTPVTTSANGTANVVVSGGTSPYTYSWSPGGQMQANLSNLNAGTYIVTVTDSNGCLGSDTVVVDSIPQSIYEENTPEFILYPNPNNGIFHVTVSVLKANAKLEIWDMKGSLILRQNLVQQLTEVNLNQEPAGLYILRMSDSNQSQRILIQK